MKPLIYSPETGYLEFVTVSQNARGKGVAKQLIKGITEQSVKEVVQNLVDDGLVDTDKIGTSVYFWAFPRYSTQLLQTLNQSEQKEDFFIISHHSVTPNS
jgi:hypothetical protein